MDREEIYADIKEHFANDSQDAFVFSTHPLYIAWINIKARCLSCFIKGIW